MFTITILGKSRDSMAMASLSSGYVDPAVGWWLVRGLYCRVIWKVYMRKGFPCLFGFSDKNPMKPVFVAFNKSQIMQVLASNPTFAALNPHFSWFVTHNFLEKPGEGLVQWAKFWEREEYLDYPRDHGLIPSTSCRVTWGHRFAKRFASAPKSSSELDHEQAWMRDVFNACYGWLCCYHHCQWCLSMA